MEERPLSAFILSLLGSVFIVVGSILCFAIYSQQTGYLVPGNFTAIFAGISVALGMLMFVITLMLYLRPDLHVAWGVTILVFAAGSITSILSGFGGFGLGVIGMVLGVVGGSIAIAWRPGMGHLGLGGPSGGGPSGVYRMCASCGRTSPWGYSFCPFCGAPAPVVAPPSPGAPPPR